MNEQEFKKWMNKFIKALNEIDRYLADKGFTEIDKIIIFKFSYEMYLKLYVDKHNFDRGLFENKVKDIVNILIDKDFIKVKEVTKK
jgi:hypothetical protein